jgi:hypothetical protein
MTTDNVDSSPASTYLQPTFTRTGRPPVPMILAISSAVSRVIVPVTKTATPVDSSRNFRISFACSGHWVRQESLGHEQALIAGHL